MKFPVETMREIARDKSEEYEAIKIKVIDTDRWTIQYEVIFMGIKTGKYYRTFWSRGATEMQEERPYDYETGEIECDEVESVEVTIKQWRKVR